MILIADRNPNVREFLKREFSAEGYRVLLAKDGQQVLNLMKDHQGLDLLVVDLDLPYSGDADLLKEIRKQIPTLPVVVHTLLPECAEDPSIAETVAYVEKEGNSVDRLKDVIFQALTNSGSRPVEV